MIAIDGKGNGSQLGLVLTCRHLGTSRAGQIRITFPSGKTANAYHWATASSGADLAALYFVCDQSTPHVPVANAEPARGSTIYQAGYPYWSRAKLNSRTGSYLGYQNARVSGVPVHDLAMKVDSGDSGSGVFDGGGSLVAVVWGGDAHGKASTSTVGLPEINRFLEEKCLACWPSLRRPRSPIGPAVPTQPTRPAQPPMQPVQPTPPVAPTQPAPVDMAPILARLQALEKQVAEFQARPGLPGKDGRDGKDGVDGKDGLPGPPGADAPAVRVRLERVKVQPKQ